MTPQEYISTGILELYALGSASASEMQEVEMMVSKFPEVKNALDEICAGLENYATLHAVEPDEKLKEYFIAEIVAGRSSTLKYPNYVSEKGKVVSLQPEKSSRFKSYAIAASVFLALSVGINIYLWIRSNSTQKEAERELSLAGKSNLELMNQMSRSDSAHYQQVNALLTELIFIKDPMTKGIPLNTMVEGHPMNAVVYWNMESKMVAVDPVHLPETSDSTKYVFWAIVNGKPVNEGNFSMDYGITGTQMIKDSIPAADAFAISLEKSANVESPAGPIYVMGKPTPSQP